MKNGYKHKTGTFGTDGEWYAAHLFQMTKQPQGALLPDLASIKGTYSPEVAIEVKTGLKAKGVLVEYQLHYEIQCLDDYRRIFREEPPERPDLLPEIRKPKLSPKRRAFYYDVLCRTDDIPSDKINTSFSAIRLTWGDHYIVPGEYGFWAFAAARAIRTGKNIEDIAESLKETMKRNIIDGESHYEVNKTSQSWQDIHGRDIAAFFYNDPALTTKEGQERTRLIDKHYQRISYLKPILLEGPNNTKIHILSQKEDEHLFENQLQSTINLRNPIVEQITRARKAAVPLLARLPLSDEDGMWHGNGEVPNGHTKKRLTVHELRMLERLTHWLDIGENVPTTREEIPF